MERLIILSWGAASEQAIRISIPQELPLLVGARGEPYYAAVSYLIGAVTEELTHWAGAEIVRWLAKAEADETETMKEAAGNPRGTAVYFGDLFVGQDGRRYKVIAPGFVRLGVYMPRPGMEPPHYCPA